MKVMVRKNDRMKIISEVFNNIKLIKMNAWEDFFYKKLNAKRMLEVEAQRKKVFSRISLLFFLWLTPQLIIASVFFLYTLLKNQLNTAQAFTIMSIFLVLQAPLADFPNFMA